MKRRKERGSPVTVDQTEPRLKHLTSDLKLPDDSAVSAEAFSFSATQANMRVLSVPRRC